LTAWYAAVLSGVLAVFATGFYLTHARSRLRAFDEELVRTSGLLARTVETELAEGSDLLVAAREALEDIALPGRSLAVFDAQGTLVAGDWPQGASFAAPPPDKGSAHATVKAASGELRAYRERRAFPGGGFEVGAAEPLLAIDRELAQLRRALGAAFLLSLALALAGGWWIARGALGPLRTMAGSAQRATGSAPGFRLEAPNPRDELGTLAASFNGLLARVDALLAQQRQFMADASHELRTPVSIARTALEVALGRPTRSADEYRDALRLVAAQMRRLSRLVDDLLTLARADAAGLRVEREPLYLDELVADVVSEARVLAAAKGVALGSAGATDVDTRGDERMLRQLFLNLLDNAIRHTPAGGKVELDLEVAGPLALVTVVDGGPGIPDGDRERVFERFVRLDGQHGDGAGLGLAIARAIAEAHGGSLALARSGPGGSAFEVRLPRMVPAA
jgi:signal transduction histidine kinase